VDSHHHDIIRLAWSRRLGLEDSALRPSHRHIEIDDNATSVTFVRLGDASALIGPESVVSASPNSWASRYTDDERSERGVLGAVGAGRSHGPILLYFAGDIGTSIDRHDPLISHELSHVLALEALCAPDDVIAAELTRKRSWFTVLGDDEPAETAAPLATAAYLEWEGVLADLGVLTAPGARRQGNGQVVARLATNDAFDEGMIPQWRTNSENGTSRRLAARLGYEEWGVFVSVELSGP
jgi:hypothetical protein